MAVTATLTQRSLVTVQFLLNELGDKLRCRKDLAALENCDVTSGAMHAVEESDLYGLAGFVGGAGPRSRAVRLQEALRRRKLNSHWT